MTLAEAKELIRVRAEEYEVARQRAENLGMMDIRAGWHIEYQVSLAKRDRAWALLAQAKQAYVEATDDVTR